MAIASPRRTGFALLLGLAFACRQDYHCDDDEQCVTDDKPGTCEPERWCSYADSICESGKRWGPQAGAHANECIAVDSGSSSGGDDSSTDSSSG
jgi:hypothetical protein